MFVKRYYGIINLKPGSELLCVIIARGEVAPHTRATDARLVAACVGGGLWNRLCSSSSLATPRGLTVLCSLITRVWVSLRISYTVKSIWYGLCLNETWQAFGRFEKRFYFLSVPAQRPISIIWTLPAPAVCGVDQMSERGCVLGSSSLTCLPSPLLITTSGTSLFCG